jgi:CRISPR-associated protein Csm3
VTELRYIGRLKLKGVLRVRSGLHIGAGKDAIEIGGIDNPVVKHPYSGDPYVPGSSLKGKARFLLEWAFNCVRHQDGRAFGFDDDDAKTGKAGADVILRLFGTAASREAWSHGPTRLIVRDAPLNADWRKEIVDDGRALTEDKTEVSIDRIAGKALDGGLRQTERVPAGARFDVEIGFRAGLAVPRLVHPGPGPDRAGCSRRFRVAGLWPSPLRGPEADRHRRRRAQLGQLLSRTSFRPEPAAIRDPGCGESRRSGSRQGRLI